ncbi:MAG: hypothetical protein HQ583_06250, partial [Candidatus Abyssubacteria bacterium]|nr:hypothetical protein [Candidatus Abyssubacteria bacterium]
MVPYLDSVPSAVDGQGSAIVRPSGPMPVGSVGDFEITFTVGEAGVAASGFVMLQISPWWGWSQPQKDYPEGAGYTEVETASGAAFDTHILPLKRVVVTSKEHGFTPGEKITFRYRGRVDKFAEAEELFQIFVDGDGDGHSACIAAPTAFRTLARSPSRLNVTSPSQARPNEAIEVRATPLDGLGNWSELPPGTYTLKTERSGRPAGEETLEAKGGEKTIAFTYAPAEEGIYFFQIEGPGELHGRSNVTLCQEGIPGLKLYFGDIHGHSRISDGTGTPEDYYRFAREVSRLDIAALTDHSDYGTIPVKGAVWERIKRAANGAYDPGQFVTNLYHDGPEGWYNPNTGVYTRTNQVWQYNFYIDSREAFLQEGTQSNPIVYWLDVSATPLDDAIFGWRTSVEHWNDDAVWADSHQGPWNELRYPDGHPFEG